MRLFTSRLLHLSFIVIIAFGPDVSLEAASKRGTPASPVASEAAPGGPEAAKEPAGDQSAYPFGQFGYMGEPQTQENGKLMTLHPAAGAGNLELLASLFKPGMNIDAPGISSETALHWAAIKGQASAAAFLLEHGANPNAGDNYERTPLHVAARANHPEMITLLLKAGADPMRYHAEGSTPLHMAATRGAASATAAFMVARTNPDLRNLFSGGTPLFDAAWSGNLETVTALLDAGADVTLLDRRNNHVLVPAVARGNPEIIKALVAKGAPIDKRDHQGHTPLHQAVQTGSETLVITLLDLGASLEAQDNQGFSALHHAVLKRDIPLIKLFLARGANLELRSLQGTVRDMARAAGDKELLEILKPPAPSEPSAGGE